MVNINKTKAPSNAPYYITGALAISALLASGVFAIAPYVGFLASVAALGLGAPLIAVCAAFSIVVAIFSAITISKNNTISEQNTELECREDVLRFRTEGLSKTISDSAKKDAQLSNQTKEIADLSKTTSEMGAQLAEKDREIEAKNQYIIYSDKDSEQKRQERKAKQQANSEGYDINLEDCKNLFDDSSQETTPKSVNGAPAESAPTAEPVKSTKAVHKQEGSKLFSPKAQALGALVGLAYLGGGLSSVFNTVNPTSLASNATDNVGDFYNDTCSNPSYVLPTNPQFVLEGKLDEAGDMFNASQNGATKNFGITNPREYQYSAANGTAEQTIFSSASPGIKERFFALFTGKGTASAVQTTVEAPVNQNDPTQGCTIINIEGPANKIITDFVPNPCSRGDYQVPLSGLKDVALCCPLTQQASHSVLAG